MAGLGIDGAEPHPLFLPVSRNDEAAISVAASFCNYQRAPFPKSGFKTRLVDAGSINFRKPKPVDQGRDLGKGQSALVGRPPTLSGSYQHRVRRQMMLGRDQHAGCG